ncbi:MAG: hypothetical protein D3914_14500, partial [Candidatus Electrothrix sp. LOE2]|nr:hypothetical protein [Candidatus Electrothrix sp. LOE2]
ERDPAFELPKEDRCAASIYGKTPQWSPALKKGLAEGLALLGSHPKVLSNCSQDKAELTAVLAVRDIFADADWVLWGSLNNLLPVLAEAAPTEFLNAVENALQVSPCPFDELFAQEDSNTIYMSGLLWALETLAWYPDYLIRVCVLLGELASRDPGGNWRNRPDNSLSTILLPWYPQTLASIEKRQTAVTTLCRELPEIGWKQVIALLPNQLSMTQQSRKPLWRNPIPNDWKPSVTEQEYQEQVSFYAEQAISLAGHDLTKLNELIRQFHNLPEASSKRLIEKLSSEAVLSIPEKRRLQLWNTLVKFVADHRRFADGQPSSMEKLILSIENVAEKLAPANPLNLYQRLFSKRDYDLYEKNGNLESQQKKLAERRQQAVKEILASGGIDSIIQFSDLVEDPFTLGNILADLTDINVDTILLPAQLKKPKGDISFSFTRGYIRHRCFNKGWSWVDSLDTSGWNKKQQCQFLCFLPFTNETWERAVEWLDDAEKEYWQMVDANPYQDSHIETSTARRKLNAAFFVVMLYNESLLIADIDNNFATNGFENANTQI